MVQVGRVGGEACSVLVVWSVKVMSTGMQSLRSVFDRKKRILQRSALRGNFLLSGFNVQCFAGRVIAIM